MKFANYFYYHLFFFKCGVSYSTEYINIKFCIQQTQYYFMWKSVRKELTQQVCSTLSVLSPGGCLGPWQWPLAKCWERNSWNVHGYLLRILEVVSQDVPGCQHCLKKSSRFMTCTWYLVWGPSLSCQSWPHGRNMPTWPVGYQQELWAITLLRFPNQRRLVHVSIIHSWRGTRVPVILIEGRLRSPHLISPTFTCLYLFSAVLALYLWL